MLFVGNRHIEVKIRGIIFLSFLGVLSAKVRNCMANSKWPLGSREPLENEQGFEKPLQFENHTLVDTELNPIDVSQPNVEQKCLERIDTYPPYNESGLYCKRTWDGKSCWDDTPAGKLEWQYCSGDLGDLSKQAIATKFCTESGQWFVHPDSQKEWTNYTLCSFGFFSSDGEPQTNPPSNLGPSIV